MAGNGAFQGGGQVQQGSGAFQGGGAVVNLPADQTMDKWTGAPALVRSAVGGAPSPGDRLATIRRYYPDAQAYGEDNFVFTDPQTKRLTLYNPPGLDPGDFPSITPEIAEGVGGIVGGALAVPAAIGGAPFTGGASFLAVPAGVGLGAAAGREAENIAASALLGRQDTRGLPQRLTDTAVTAGVNSVGQRVADLAIQGVKSLVGPAVRRVFTRATPAELRAAYDNLGIEQMAGAATGSRPVQIAEHALSYTPGGAATMQTAAERTLSQTGQAARTLAQSVGGESTPQQVGGMLRQAGRDAAERFATRRQALDQGIEAAIGGDTPTVVGNVRRLLGELQSQLRMAPRARQADLSRAINELNAIVADAQQGGGGLPFRTIRQIRTRIGRELDRPDIAGYRPGEDANMARVYAALSEDIRVAADNAGPDARRALDLHDRYVRYQRTVNIPLLQEMENRGADEAVYNWALQGGRDGGTRLLRLRYNVRTQAGEGTWDELVSSVISRMGRATPGAQGAPSELLGAADTFSPSTFLTNFAKLSPEAKSALFGGRRYQALRDGLDDLVKVTASLKDSEKMANHSGTGRAILFSALSLAGGQVIAGDVGGAAATVGSSVVTPYVAARLITNPRFVRWLALSRNISSDPNSLARHLGRLVAIGEAEPEIKDAVNQYYAAVRQSPALGGASATGAPQ